jgi:hypothetical protein
MQASLIPRAGLFRLAEETASISFRAFSPMIVMLAVPFVVLATTWSARAIFAANLESGNARNRYALNAASCKDVFIVFGRKYRDGSGVIGDLAVTPVRTAYAEQHRRQREETE